MDQMTPAEKKASELAEQYSVTKADFENIKTIAERCLELEKEVEASKGGRG